MSSWGANGVQAFVSAGVQKRHQGLRCAAADHRCRAASADKAEQAGDAWTSQAVWESQRRASRRWRRRLKSLHSLKLGGTSRVATIQDGSVAAIAAMTSLTHLDLSGSHDISDEGEASAYLQPPELISTNCALEVPAALQSHQHLVLGEQDHRRKAGTLMSRI